MGALGEFEGRPVVASKVVVKNAGDGLTKPLAAEPRTWHTGERVPMLLWGTFGGVGFEETKDGVQYVRVQKYITEEAAVLDHVDPAMLEALLADQRAKVRAWEVEQMIEEKRAKDAKAGQVAIEVDEGDGSELLVPDEVDGERLPEVSDADWEQSARAQGVSPIGSKQARKAKG